MAEPADVERITIALRIPVANKLREILALTGLNKTEQIGRAIQVYHFIETEMAKGSELVLRHKENGTEQVVRFF